MYREAGENKRIRPLVLTELQKAIIKKVTGLVEDGSSVDSNNDSTISVSDVKKGRKLKISYPYEELDLVPTRASMSPKK